MKLLDGFVPALGDVFDVWDAASVSGEFLWTDLPTLPAGLFWNSSKADTTGELFVVATPPSYAEFSTYYGLMTPADGDEDSDGVSNAVEYVSGSDPTEPGDAGQPSLQRDAGNELFQFRLTNPLGSDVMLIVEDSTDLQNWDDAATWNGGDGWVTTGGATVSSVPAGVGYATIVVSNLSSGTRRFYRLSVEISP